MSKTKNSGATHYEILFIVPNKFTEDEAKTVSAQVEKVITENEGKITFSEFWGKKKLAYEIKHNAYGYYSLFEFDLEGKNLAKIDKNFRLSTDILRHQIIIKKAKSEKEIAKDKIIRAKIDSKKASEEKGKEEKAKKASAPAYVSRTATSTSKEKEVKETKIDLKDLDEKLEGILNAKDLI